MVGRLLLFAALSLAAMAQEIQLERVASGIAAPTDIQNAGDGSGRLFLVQQNGLIKILRNGSVLSQPFLDIRGKTTGSGERGLLGLAFPPGFAQSGRFYVDYTDLRGNTVIAMYRVSANPDVADAASEVPLLNIPQPFENHNGGQVRFGPDGYLYIAMGDGGSGGDPMRNGQSLGTLLGKLLRVDVESEPGRALVPSDNPFAGRAGARGEIWAYGLRNPWRFSFDSATNDLWIGDVGQDVYEEIDFQPAGSRGGENYGWNRMEGLHCYQANCDQQGLTLPVAEYTHRDGCSVIGGAVYRGQVSPGLRGTYLYGDLCSGTIWGLERQGSGWANRRIASAGFTITTFGVDEAGELYVGNADASAIMHIVGSGAPRITAEGVVNAASFAAGLTPGSLATVFTAGVLDTPGIVSASRLPLPGSLAEVSVTVNGTAAPVLAVANVNGREQVNFQAPFELTGQSTATVVVARAGKASAAVGVPLLETQPAIYTSDGSQAVIVHSDYTLVTPANPLRAGEFAFLYAAGLGRVSNPPATGAAAASAPLSEVVNGVTVSLGGVQAEVPFAGLAPGFAGVYQVNFRVPANVPPGAVDLILRNGQAVAPAVRTAVQ